MALALAPASAGAQTASLLPPGMQQFSDGNGNPLAGGSVGLFVPGTSVPKASWLDAFQANLNPNPLTLDANGRAVIFGQGAYREVLRDAAGNTIWDALIYAPATSGGGSSGGGLPNAVATGTANAITASITGFSLTQGTAFTLKASANNTAGATLNVSATGITNLLKQSTSGVVALVANDLVLGQEYLIVYDGTQYEVLNPSNGAGTNLVNGPGASTNGFIPQWNGTSGTLLGTGLQVGTGANNLVQLDSNGNLPAVGAQNLKNVVLANYVGGLSLSNDSISPNTVMDTSAGLAVSDDQTTAMALVTFSKNANSAWVVGSGQGCADGASAYTSLGASTWYHIYVIERLDTGVVDEVCSKSATSPTLPSGYTKKKRIGSFKTDGSSHIIAFTQYILGHIRLYNWSGTPPEDISNQSVANGSTTAFTLASVPSGIKVEAHVIVTLINASTLATGSIWSPDQLNANSANLVMPSTAHNTVGEFWLMTNTSQVLDATCGQNSTTMTIDTLGWRDFL